MNNFSFNLSADFIFHSIGQGLFYSGNWEILNHSYSMVYDCGTKSDNKYLDNAINKFRAKKKIDLLAISHFHDDHVNGIEKLLSRTSGTKEVVLPYLYPTERLMLIYQYIKTNKLTSNNINENNYLELMYEPHRYFGDAKIKYIYSNEENHEEELHEKSNVEFFRNIYEPSCKIWKFKFCCLEGDHLKLRSEIEDCLKNLGVNINMPLREIINKHLKEVENVYNSLIGKKNYNAASMLCYHGPSNSLKISSRNFTTNIYKGTAKTITYPYPQEKDNIFQMLTGDIMTGKRTILYEKNFDESERSKVGVFLVPHHGANSSFHKNFVSLHDGCFYWPCSFGLGNIHHHPSPSVVNDIINSGMYFIPVNQIQDFKISYKFDEEKNIKHILECLF